MRADEDYACKILVSHLTGRSHVVSVLPGREPPDYYLEVDGVKYAVEITQLHEQVNAGKRIISRHGADIGVRRWLRSVEEDLVSKGLMKGSYVVRFSGDSFAFDSLKTVLQKRLVRFLDSSRLTIRPRGQTLVNRAGLRVSVSKVDDTRDELYPWPETSGDENVIDPSLVAILNREMADKRSKLKGIVEPLILVGINQHSLAIADWYLKAFRSVQDDSFTGIYVVDKDTCLPLRAIPVHNR